MGVIYTKEESLILKVEIVKVNQKHIEVTELKPCISHVDIIDKIPGMDE